MLEIPGLFLKLLKSGFSPAYAVITGMGSSVRIDG